MLVGAKEDSPSLRHTFGNLQLSLMCSIRPISTWHCIGIVREPLHGSQVTLKVRMGILTFTLVATMLAVLAFTRCRNVLAESGFVATAVAVVNLVFDLQLMPSPPRPVHILFYGAGNFILSWILGFAIATIVGLVANRLRRPPK